MFRIILITIIGIIVSLFYFPITPPALSGVNSKMIIAVCGIFVGIWRLRYNRKGVFIPKNIIGITLISFVISLIGFFSVTYNTTQDYAYATYIFSMLVWLSAAYFICVIIKALHDKITYELIGNYLIGVCLFQCIIAQVIDIYPNVDQLLYPLIGDTSWLKGVNRLYGIGATLDTAGIRFSVVLVIIAFLLSGKTILLNSFNRCIYIFVFLFITVFGSMIARTTYVGFVIGIIFLIYMFKPWELKFNIKLSIVFVLIILVVFPLISYMYNTDMRFHQLIRFAFEGYFNLIEKGEWSIASNNKLESMIVYPKTIKTWIIGDGYFSNPYYTDFNYIGKRIEGWYMGTDIGYLRFIFYFGLIGLLTFCYFIYYTTIQCVKSMPKYKILFVLIMIVGFICWFKVSTDIFLIFALFICVANLQDEKELDSLNQ